MKVDWFVFSSYFFYFRYIKEFESVVVLIVKLIKVKNFLSCKKFVLIRKVYCVVIVGKNFLFSVCVYGDELIWNEFL